MYNYHSEMEAATCNNAVMSNQKVGIHEVSIDLGGVTRVP